MEEEKKEFEIRLAEVEPFRKQIKIARQFVSEVNLNIDKESFGFRVMTLDNVVMVTLKVLSSSCIEYDVKKKTKIGLSINQLYDILKVINKNDIIVLSRESDKFIIEAKNKNTKRFSIPIIELEEKDQKEPQLKFKAKVITDSTQFKEELKALDTVCESVLFSCHKDKLVLGGYGDITKLETTIKEDDNTKIENNTDKVITSRYTMDFLKKILESSILSDTVTLEFDKDYPLRATFKEIDRYMLEFILAPRVEND